MRVAIITESFPPDVVSLVVGINAGAQDVAAIDMVPVSEVSST
ncbi:MAG: hypothetical protein ACRDPY_18790 [Streptosporangiaceae bacterium]